MTGRIRSVAGVVILLLVLLVGQLTYLQLVDAAHLNNDPRNIRSAIRRYTRPRGEIRSADGVVLARSIATDDPEIRRKRVYEAGNPPGELFAHVTGYSSFLRDPTGVEKVYNSDLTGATLALDPSAFGSSKELTNSVELSVDARLQQVARDALGADQNGAVVLVDVRSGAIKAFWANPSYDPNALASLNGTSVNAAWDFLLALPSNPLLSRAYRVLYPPGSTFKIVTTALALESGVTTNTVFPAVRELTLPLTSSKLRNFGGQVCGGTLAESFRKSCNSTFGQIGLDLGEAFVDGIHTFGFGTNEAPPIDLDSAAASKGTAAGTFKTQAPTFAQAAIGQGDISTTPLHMALVAASVANGGVMMKPHVGERVVRSDGSVDRTVTLAPWKTVMRPDTATTLIALMRSVVQNGTGTGAAIAGADVIGKTGTAEAGSGAAHAWFVGAATSASFDGPDDGQPRYAIAVVVEHGGTVGSEATGGRVAAPVARKVLEAALNQ